MSDQTVLLMEDVSHKLQCLNYEVEFKELTDSTLFHQLYFALPAAHTGYV